MSLLLYMSATNSSSDTSVSVISVSIPLAFLLLLTSSSACKKSNYIDLWQPADPLWSMAPWCLMSFPIYHAILGLIVKNFSYVRYVWKIFLLFLSKRYDRISLHNRTSCFSVHIIIDFSPLCNKRTKRVYLHLWIYKCNLQHHMNWFQDKFEILLCTNLGRSMQEHKNLLLLIIIPCLFLLWPPYI